jgi:hypothetical protein
MTEPKHIRLLGSRSRIVLDDGAVTEILSNHWTGVRLAFSPRPPAKLGRLAAARR